MKIETCTAEVETRATKTVKRFEFSIAADDLSSELRGFAIGKLPELTLRQLQEAVVRVKGDMHYDDFDGLNFVVDVPIDAEEL